MESLQGRIDNYYERSRGPTFENENPNELPFDELEYEWEKVSNNAITTFRHRMKCRKCKTYPPKDNGTIQTSQTPHTFSAENGVRLRS
jgi:hypothetical protein